MFQKEIDVKIIVLESVKPKLFDEEEIAKEIFEEIPLADIKAKIETLKRKLAEVQKINVKCDEDGFQARWDIVELEIRVDTPEKIIFAASELARQHELE